MNELDLLITTLILGAAFNGMRRGFLREALTFSLWVPIYALMVIFAFKTYLPAQETTDTIKEVSNNIFLFLGGVYLMGMLFISFINKAFLTPWLARRRLHNTATFNSFFGFILGGGRFLTLVVLTVFLYDVFISPFSVHGVPNSAYIKKAYQETKPIKRWLIKENHLKQEIILYDRDHEEEKNRKSRIKKEFDGVFNFF